MPADDVADQVVDAVHRDRFWVLTHPEYLAQVDRRARGIAAGDIVVEARSCDVREKRDPVAAREKIVSANGVDLFVRERGDRPRSAADQRDRRQRGHVGRRSRSGSQATRPRSSSTRPERGARRPRGGRCRSRTSRDRRRPPRRARPHRGRRARLLVRRARGTGAGPPAAGARAAPGTRRDGLRLGEQARDDGVAGADHDARPLPLPHRLRAHEPASQPRRRGARRPSPAPHGGPAALPAAAPRVRLSDDGRDVLVEPDLAAHGAGPRRSSWPERSTT